MLMNVNILCRDGEEQKIKEALLQEKTDKSTYDRVYVISWMGRESYRNQYPSLRDKTVWFWVRGMILHGPEEVKTHLSKALEEENWQLVKSINDVLREYDLIERKKELYCYPSEMQIESTNVCNAKCIMCSHSYDHNQNAGFIDTGFLDSIRSILPYLRIVYLHGNGEPFLNQAIPEIIAEMARYEIRFMTNTNLSILTDEILDCIKEHFEALNVSCDGATKETFEMIRKNLKFDVFCENCRRVKAYCPDLYMTMTVVSMRQNVKELPQMVELAAELGFQQIVFSQLCPDVLIGNQMDALEHYPNVAQYYYKEAVKKGADLGLKVVVPGNVDHHIFSQEAFEEELELLKEGLCQELAKVPAKIQQNTESPTESVAGSFPQMLQQPKQPEVDAPACQVRGICDWVIKRPYINLEQKVNLCCISQMRTMGDLKQQIFDEIWNGQTYQNIRQMFLDGLLPDVCQGCEFLLQGTLEHMIMDEYHMKSFEYRKERKE